jgi:hypothetical protein
MACCGQSTVRHPVATQTATIPPTNNLSPLEAAQTFQSASIKAPTGPVKTPRQQV